jgi:hypothetical protein
VDFFRDFTFHWWQFGVMKIALIAFGILIGSSWSGFFRNGKVRMIVWLAFIVPALYSAFVALQQVR